jgi:hypothetical protein
MHYHKNFDTAVIAHPCATCKNHNKCCEKMECGKTDKKGAKCFYEPQKEAPK